MLQSDNNVRHKQSMGQPHGVVTELQQDSTTLKRYPEVTT